MISRAKIVRIIEERGLKQWEIARRSGLPQGTISNLINGKGRVSERTLLRLAEALGVPEGDVREDFTPDPAIITSSRALDLALQPNSKRAKRFRDTIELMWNATFRTVDYDQQCLEEFGIDVEQNKASHSTIPTTDTTLPENS